MAKETFYFSHDYNPTNDPKIVCLIGNYGGLGYGVFWRIIEMLHQENNNKLPLKEYIYEAIAKQMLTSAEQIKAIVDDCLIKYELFSADNDFFWSERVIRNIEKRQEISEIRSIAGKSGAIAKQNLANVSKEKERKEKEIKGNNIIEREQQVAPPSNEVRLFFLDVDKQEEVLNHLKGKGIEENMCRREIAKFISYWTEPNKSGTKQRWEIEQTFEISRRLTTWFSRIGTFNKTFQKDNLSKVIKI